jgi:two-component system KDP operon response regulator KdpE
MKEVKMKAAIIEDDPQIVESVSLCFELKWPEVKFMSSLNGKGGIELVKKENPDIVVLDLGLPDMDGFDVLRHIRSFSDVPVIILTVRKEEATRIEGLELGADDYITKPFSPGELMARVKVVLRRAGRVTIRGREINLTPVEFKLLYAMAQHDGEPLPQGFLLREVWGEMYVDSHQYLDVCIQRLRSKMESDPSQPKLILDVEGGYMFLSGEEKKSKKSKIK